MAFLENDPLCGTLITPRTLDSTHGPIPLGEPFTQKTILFFYPKDLTSGCTTEACDFEAQHLFLQSKNVRILGISKDSIKSHLKFQEKYNLGYPLISDPLGELCQTMGVWKEKSMYGKKYFGIERSTFVFDTQGVITHIWRKVSVPNHVSDVLSNI